MAKRRKLIKMLN